MRLFRSNVTRVERMSSQENILSRNESPDDSSEPPTPPPMPTDFTSNPSMTSNRARLQKSRHSTTGVKEHLRIFCFQNLTSSFVLVVIVLILKVCMSLLYVVRVSLEDQETCSYCGNSTGYDDEEINWRALFWVQKDLPIWIIEVAISVFTLTRMLIVTYVRFKGNCCRIFTINLCLEVVVSTPFIITIFREEFRQFYIPSFLNCWLAKRMLEQNVLSHRKMLSLSLFTHKVVEVTTTMVCLIFTGLCGVQHIQRGSSDEDSRLDLFQSFYFVMVTFSTVGYGDYSPDIWPSQLLVVVLIFLAIVVLPQQLESLASTWMEHQRMGGSYAGGGGGGGAGGRGQAGGEMKHVVFYGATVNDQLLEEFLNEFFSQRHLQDYFIVFMSSSEPDQAARRLLQSPLWLHRVMFIRGSLLRDVDLARAGMKYAKACFLMGNDSHAGKSEADQKTIVRSWSMRDYAPNVPLYVQVFRPESGVHLKFAKFVVCEEEFKFAMLAYNCLVPGTATMLSLLLHSSTGEEGQSCAEPWLRLYGKHSGNEIYSIRLSESLVFCDFEGSHFTIAALYGHRTYGVTLIGVQTSNSPDSILLNPGFSHILKGTDVLFYLSINSEEEMNFDSEPISSSALPSVDSGLTQDPKTSPFADFKSSRNLPSNVDVNTISRIVHDNPHRPPSDANNPDDESSTEWITQTEHCELRVGILPEIPYVGIPKTLCHLRKEKKSICCLSLDEICKHCSYSNIKQYAWANRAIILVAEMANCGFFNFVIPLRVAHHPRQHLRPIVIMLEKRPDDTFLDVLAWFPLVYWMTGSLTDLDSVLTAGINFADNVVIVGRDADRGLTEDDADCATIVTLQTLQKYFSDVKFTTELSQTSNMRFVHFDAQSEFGQSLAMIEKIEKQRGSSIPFMFRTQFAEGSVYNSSMLSNLLYQAFVKDYLIPVIRGLLGLVQTPGSGFLTSVSVAKNKPWATTYGSFFTYLSVTTGDVPVAIFRTELGTTNKSVVVEGPGSLDEDEPWEADEINNLVKSRLTRLGLSKDDYEYNRDERKMLSYVVINPEHGLPLDDNDIVIPNCTFVRPIHQIRIYIDINIGQPRHKHLQITSMDCH